MERGGAATRVLRKRRMRLSGVPCAVVPLQAWPAPRSPRWVFLENIEIATRIIDRQRGDRGGGELTMLLLQEESALVARDFWRSAPPLVAVPSELLAFELEAGSPSPPPQMERAGDEGRQETRRPSKTEHASPPISRIRWLRPSPPLGLLFLGVGCLTPHASRLPHRELQTYGGDHGPH